MLDFRRIAPWCVVLCSILTVWSSAQPNSAGLHPGQAAEQVYKNIQVFRGTPADQLMPSMLFISSSLGVHCEHCHVEGAFDQDEKKPKQQARQMIRMVDALNQNSFAGQREITCYSCHRGTLRPRRTPAVAGESTTSNPTGQRSAASAAAVQALDTYLLAVGGVDALRKISTEKEAGFLDLGTGTQFPLTVFLKSPGMRYTAVQFSTGESLEILNGDAGWSLIPGRSLHAMSPAEIQAARMGADPDFIARVKTSFTVFEVRPDTIVGGRAVTAIRASNPNSPPLRLFIDKQSGLLVRMVRYVDSPLGRNPTQIDYSDYRNVSGIMQPFRWTVAQPQGRYVVQLNRIDVNVPLEDSRFAKPDPLPAAQGR